MKTKIMQNIKSVIIALVLFAGVGYVSAASTWSAPHQTPPSCDPTLDSGCNPPVNVGTTAQFKNGPLTIGGSTVPTTSYKLDVPGLASFQGITTQALTMTTGAAADKVLTSDATGNATWTSVAPSPIKGWITWIRTSGIQASVGIASVTNGTNNRPKVTFSSPMPDSNYAVICNGYLRTYLPEQMYAFEKTTTYFTVFGAYGTSEDAVNVMDCVIIR